MVTNGTDVTKSSKNNYKNLKFVYYWVCSHICSTVCVYVCEGQWSTCRNLFSLPTMWVPGTQITRLGGKLPNLLGQRLLCCVFPRWIFSTKEVCFLLLPKSTLLWFQSAPGTSVNTEEWHISHALLFIPILFYSIWIFTGWAWSGTQNLAPW